MHDMNDELLENFRRIPGLYRRWELTEICKPNHNYQIEDAGRHADGSPLLAIYVSDLVPNAAMSSRCETDFELGE